ERVGPTRARGDGAHLADLPRLLAHLSHHLSLARARPTGRLAVEHERARAGPRGGRVGDVDAAAPSRSDRARRRPSLGHGDDPYLATELVGGARRARRSDPFPAVDPHVETV